MRRSVALIASVVILTYLSGCTGSGKPDTPATDATKAQDKKDAPAEERVTPLFELLGKLPKDRWPKDNKDTLKWEEAFEWFKKNIAGRRASWSCPPRTEDIKFQLDEKTGKYSAMLQGRVPSVELYTGKWDWRIETWGVVGGREDDFNLEVNGLSKQAAEKLREIPKDKTLDLTFKIQSVRRDLSQHRAVIVEQITIKGIGPYEWDRRP